MSERTPTKPGFYWAIWQKADPGTPEGDEQTPALEWEIVHVVENCLDEDDPEYLMAAVPGQSKWQSLENFTWGAFVADERLVLLAEEGAP